MSVPTFYVEMYRKFSDVPIVSRPFPTYSAAFAAGEAELYRDDRNDYYIISKHYEKRDKK
jgi:hypothetical protein